MTWLPDRFVQYEALRRVHLIPASDVTEQDESVNENVFRNLDSPVSEGGENFSTGYRIFDSALLSAAC